MKKLLLSLLFFYCTAFNVFGQSSSIEISNFKYRVKGDERICEAYVKLTAYFKDQNQAPVEFYYEDYGEGTFTSPSPDAKYTYTGEISKIRVYAYTHEKTQGRGCSKAGTKIAQDKYIELYPESCKTGSYYGYIRNGGDFEAENELWFDYEIYHIVNLINPGADTSIGYDDPLDLSVTPESINFNKNVYNWQYHIEGDDRVIKFKGVTITRPNWHDLPSGTQGEEKIDLLPSSFLPKNAIGKKISFRINQCGSVISNVVTYDLFHSAPHISRTETQNPLCLGDTGSVKIYFDRNIDPNEALYYVLYDSSEIIGYTTGSDPQPIYRPIDNNTAPITTFVPDGNGGYYLEITDLPPSNSYFFEFIGFGRDTEFGNDNNNSVTLPNSEYNGAPLYTGAINHQTTIIIERPVPVEFVSITSTDVMCNSGSDGEITIEAKGGTENYLCQIKSNGTYSTAIPFTNQYTHTITGLQADAYSIKIQDTHGCVASVIEYDPNTSEPISLGDEIIESVTINEPAPLVVTVVDTLHPRAFGFKDGYVKIKIEGGTPENGSYTVEWTDENGAILTDVLKETVNNDYYETLQNLPEGIYIATITDNNYNNTSDNQGCTAVIAQQLIQPEKLTVTLLETNPIYCNTENSNDEFKINSGELTAYASGGVPFKNGENGGLPYIYTWTVEDENGNLQTVYNSTGQAVTDSILGNIGKGMYHLNIEDANGVILGEYPNQTLTPVTPKDSIIELKEPTPILLDFSKKDVFCNSGNDGYAEVSVTGGNAPYNILWSTGEKTARINNLIAGSYIAYITDKNGCFTSEKVTINQPGELNIRIDEQKSPTCADGNDGAIAITVDGGVGSYEYLWSNNETSPRIDQLSAGTYSVQINDGQGCIAFKEFVLENPEPVLIDLGSDRILCNDQQINLDVTINDSEAHYQWESDNGFTSSSPAVSLSEAGHYKVTVTTPEGCMGTDEITLGFSNTDIDSYFLLASQAFVNEEVILVNVSYPESESVEWFAPDDAEVIASSNDGLILKFKEKGSYTILMRAYIGNCYMDFQKSIIVEEPADLIDIGDADSPFILDFKAVPNPSNGNFKVSIALAETCDVSLRLFNILTASMTNEKRLTNSKSYEVDYQLSIPSGTYLLLMETPKENRTIKVIIN